MKGFRMGFVRLPLALCASLLAIASVFAASSIGWGSAVLINNIPTFTDAGTDARNLHPGTFGSEYGRMLRLANGNWLAVYAIYRNNGYTHDPNGGTELRFSRSTDNGRSWTDVATLTDPGRDLDNGQMIQLPNGTILMACRSVRWQESYRLRVYRSTDNGSTWSYLSTIESNEGAPGSLGNPDKGVYEPHFYFLDNGNLAVMYANEKHVTENPSYSQIISEKVSTDGGATWGAEIWVAAQSGGPRPGMPVWTRMNNGQFIVVYEVCGPQNCNVYYKIGNGGTSWPAGLGTQIPNQLGGPYILSMSDGRLLVTSNSGNISYSNDFGATWQLTNAAWANNTLWGSLYQTAGSEVGAMSSASRAVGGHNVQIKYGNLDPRINGTFDGNASGWSTYGGSWSVNNNEYLVNASSADKAIWGGGSYRVFVYEASVYLANAGQGSLIFNVNNPGNGADAFQGYGAGIDSNGVVWLGRFNNSWTQLSSASMTISTGTWYRLKVLVDNGNIRVFVNDALKINYNDSTYSSGSIGVRGGFGNSVRFDNISIGTLIANTDFANANGWNTYGGSWSIANGEYVVNSNSADKSVFGSNNFTNYALEADINLTNGNQGSLIFNVNNPGVGTDTLQGYGAGIDAAGLVWLGRFNNGWTALTSASTAISPNTWYHMKIVYDNGNIKVYLNGALKLTYADSTFKSGRVGVRGGFGNSVRFDNLWVYTTS